MQPTDPGSDLAPPPVSPGLTAGDCGSRAGQSLCLRQLLGSRVELDPGAIAIKAPGRGALTYRELKDQVDRTTRDLASFGLRHGDRVAVLLPNGPEMASAFLAVASALVCAPLNLGYRRDELEFYLTDLGARALLTTQDIESPAREVAERLGMLVIELITDPHAPSGRFSLRGAPAAEAGPLALAQPGDVALVLHTSGTTSRPKIVPLTQANLCHSALAVQRTLALIAGDRCLNVMPLFHIHGLVAGLLAPLAGGGSVICAPGFDADRFFAWMDEEAPTWFTAVPTMHRALLSRASAAEAVVERRPLRFIRSSSASLPPMVMEGLERAFRTQVIEAYGMTEAAHQITSNPLAPRERKAGSVGLAAGPEVAIMSDSGELVPRGATGEVVIRGPSVAAGYENNPEANRGAFSAGWFRTGDQGRLDADNYLFLTGRLKEIINRGGEKVAPREVDEVLLQHPAVEQAVAFALPHSTLGEEVVAAVVLRAGHVATAHAVRDFAAGRLADYKAPKQVLIVPEIPKGPTGKLQRIGLADTFKALLPAPSRGAQAPVHDAHASSVEAQIALVWRRLLDCDRIDAGDDFRLIGGDSLSLTTMILEVETAFGTRVPVDAFLRDPTIETLARLVREGAGRAAASPEAPVATVDGAAPAAAIRDSMLGGLKNRLLQWVALYVPGYRTTRVWLHRLRGVTIGSNVSIGVSTLIETAYPRLVYIGNNVTIGMRVVIIGHLRDSTEAARQRNRHSVRIEDDVYIGPGAIVLPNVTIRKGAVVSAGSVVTRSIPERVLVQGNPAVPVARCGVSLGGGVSYEQFVRHLVPFGKETAPPAPDRR